MLEFLIGGFIGWALSRLVSAVILAITAWLMVEVASKVANYLREKRLEFAHLYKGKALQELIKNADDPEVKAELRRIKKAHDGLLVPLRDDENPDYDSICVVSPDDKTYDSAYDHSLIADDESYAELD